MRGGVGAWRRVSAWSVLCALTAVCAPAAQAAPPVAAEKSLLGIRILQTYKDVFRKYGPPNRVYRYDELVDLVEATDSQGRLTGGIRGLADDMQGGGNMGPGAGGFPGMAGGAMGRPGGF